MTPADPPIDPATGSATDSGPLAGLTVVDVSTTIAGAMATLFFADAGADVIVVEAPTGNPVRRDPGWPGLLRGKRSVVADVHTEPTVLDGLLRHADVLVTAMRPSAAQRLGLTDERLTTEYPRLVTARITGWGSRGPWAQYKGYDALVLAKCGVFHSKRQLTTGPDPAYVSTPYASYGAAQAAIQGVLAALYERESSGRGQVVEANLVLGTGAMDPYNWFYEMVLHRYPEAFKPQATAFDEQGRPQARLMYALLVAAAKDGTWLQFAHTAPRLMQAWLEELGLDEEVRKPEWAGFPDLPTPELRSRFWDMMLSRVGERTVAEWEDVFARNSNVFGEQFRTPAQALDHPQVVHDGRSVTVNDPDLGPVRQPSTLVHAGRRPLTAIRRAPRLGEHSDELRALAASGHSSATDAVATAAEPPSGYPLDGVTVMEMGAMFAGPFGATLMADLGARVIKIEPLEGDNIRNVMAFPEAGGGKVMQGKESIALNLQTPEGRAVVHELVKHCDVVLQCFRAGAAARAGIDEATLKSINPDLVYVNAPAYGIDGPYALKPAYAPSVGAASGVALCDAPTAGDRPETHDELWNGARMLWAGGAVPAVNSDGIAALGVGSGLMLALYAKRRGITLTDIVTTMLGSCMHALIGRNTSYADRPQQKLVDAEFRGLGPLYRMYRAADGWVFLAAPADDEWQPLLDALGEPVELADGRFATPQRRAEHAGALADALAAIFLRRGKQEWEDDLTSRDVGCVAVAQQNAEWQMQGDEFYAAGYAIDAVSPIFAEHRRPAPLNSFSRSRTFPRAGCTLGQHTDALLREIGYDDEQIAALHRDGVVR